MPVPVITFKEPFITARGDELVLFSNKDLSSITEWDVNGHWLVNVTDRGVAGFRWILDANGDFFAIKSLGVLPKTLFQRLLITNQKEKFEVLRPRIINVGELKSLVEHAKDPLEDESFPDYARDFLQDQPDERVVDREMMAALLGGTDP